MHPVAATVERAFPLRKLEWLLLALSLVLWLSSSFWLPGLLVWTLLAGINLVLARHRWKVMLVLFCLSPLFWVPALSFAKGSVDYHRNDAAWQTTGSHADDYTFGFSDDSFRLLDPHPDYGVQVVSSGCLVDGSEGFYQYPNNAAIALWTSVFGYMEGAYDGPYPTFAEAYETLETPDGRFQVDELESDDTQRRLGLGSEISRWLHDAFAPTPQNDMIRYAHLDEDTLLITKEERGFGDWYIFLLDLERQEVVIALRDDIVLSRGHDRLDLLP